MKQRWQDKKANRGLVLSRGSPVLKDWLVYDDWGRSKLSQSIYHIHRGSCDMMKGYKITEEGVCYECNAVVPKEAAKFFFVMVGLEKL